ncbi:MAG: AAA family ATPase [Actinomycetota bacterium]|nr:AAA family ATPase [Actinomycetota bacterium]
MLEFEGDIAAPAFRVWATRSGVAVGLHAGYAGSGWHREVAALASEALPEGIEFIEIRGHATGDRLRPAAETFPGNETFIGRWFPNGDALDGLDFRDDVLETVEELKDVLGMIVQRLGIDEKHASGSVPPGSDLADEVEAFKRSRPYPQEKDRWHHDQRDEMAARLTPESLQDLDLDTFRLLINGKRYGNPGPQSRLNTFLGEAGPDDLSRLTHAVRYLLWGEDNDPTRIDRVLDQDDLGVYGLGESVVMKLLSVAHPERYVPVFPYTGEMGKLAMLDLLGVEHPDVADGSRGSRQVAANDALRSVLQPHFDDDAWGMGQFLYWKRAQDEAAPRGSEDVLGRLADEVLLDESFLQEVVSLLRDRGQVVFYGPPGTGKTFLARRLAEMLAPDATRRSIVQFHPSTSYEDFVEGFRPDSAGDALTYRLVKGPLARLAEAAEEAPGVDHVLVIDELNRANLPRVFGELLYLLEYRDEGVNPLYRPDELFVLPKNVLVIGTMNTADRSIALVDVALRRRFHFVPFLPDSGPLTGLLERWLDRHGEPGWVADLVAMVNDELEERLGGPHLKLGPSYFMEHNLDEDRLRRIWTYDIYPRIEEHLYGEWDELKRYSWSEVLRRFRSEQPVVADQSDLPDGPAPDEVEP